MHILSDKLFLFIFCSAWMLLISPSPDFYCITAFLAGLCFTCFFSCLNPEGKLQTQPNYHPCYFLLFVCYLGLCLFLPESCIYLPLIFYDLLYTRCYPLYVIGFLVCIYKLPTTSPLQLSLFVLSFLLAVLLHMHSQKLSALSRQIREIQDNSREYNLKLTAKNKDLLERQDYEIYLATLKERNRIAREIHDNVGHMLSRSLLQSGALIAINHDEALKEPLFALKDTLNHAMDNIRESVHDLHDDSIDLKSAIEQMFLDYKNYQILFDYDMGHMVASNVKYCFISITKEALSNLSRHSNATKLEITMREHPNLYQLLIKDNGTDIVMHDSGIGLSNMQERVNNLGGSFTLTTNGGFRIFISIPKKETL